MYCRERSSNIITIELVVTDHSAARCSDLDSREGTDQSRKGDLPSPGYTSMLYRKRFVRKLLRKYKCAFALVPIQAPMA